MSRIGKKPIEIPQGVDVKIDGRNVIVKGPKGQLSQTIAGRDILVEKKDNFLIVGLEKETKPNRALWGTIRALLQNNILGVTAGFEKKLEMVGVGYKASCPDDKMLRVEAGFSHPVIVALPDGITATVAKNVIVISGIDKQQVGETAARIRKIRVPEPYKGKGIRYQGEIVRRKEGKKAAAAK